MGNLPSRHKVIISGSTIVSRTLEEEEEKEGVRQDREIRRT